MNILAFVVLAGLALVVLLTYSKRHRNRDRWPYNLDKSSDIPGAANTDPGWGSTANTLFAAGTISTLGDNSPSATQQASDSAGSTSFSCDHGATGSWGGTGSTGGGFDGGGDGGGDDGSGD